MSFTGILCNAVHLPDAPEPLFVPGYAQAQQTGNKSHAGGAGYCQGLCHLALTSRALGSRFPILHAASIAARVAANPIVTNPIASIMSITTLLCEEERLMVLRGRHELSEPGSMDQCGGQMSAALLRYHKRALLVKSAFYQG
jgi:hypothetical protein